MDPKSRGNRRVGINIKALEEDRKRREPKEHLTGSQISEPMVQLRQEV